MFKGQAACLTAERVYVLSCADSRRQELLDSRCVFVFLFRVTLFLHYRSRPCVRSRGANEHLCVVPVISHHRSVKKDSNTAICFGNRCVFSPGHEKGSLKCVCVSLEVSSRVLCSVHVCPLTKACL